MDGSWQDVRHALRRMASRLLSTVALAVVLLGAAGLLIESLGRFLEASPGFDARNLLAMAIELPDPREHPGAEPAGLFGRLVAGAESLGDLVACGLVIALPIPGWQGPTPAYAEGQPIPASMADVPVVGYRAVSPESFARLGLALRRGRLLSDRDDARAPRVAVLNQTAARQLFGDDDPLGRRLHFDKPDNPGWTIVGVTSDHCHDGLAVPVSSEVYLPLAQEMWGRVNLVVRTSVPHSSVTADVGSLPARFRPSPPEPRIAGAQPPRVVAQLAQSA